MTGGELAALIRAARKSGLAVSDFVRVAIANEASRGVRMPDAAPRGE